MKSAKLGAPIHLFSLTACASTAFFHDREGFCTTMGTKSFAIMDETRYLDADVTEEMSETSWRR
jgi:hypothetical protein